MAATDPAPSDVTADDPGGALPGRRHPACVTLAFQSERPLDAPLRISLAGIDTVRFSRGPGPARAEKVRKGPETILKIEVPDRFLSASHASLERILGRWLLEDKGSRNGTFVDGVQVERCAIEDGTAFEIGHSFFVFRAAAPEEPVAPLPGSGWTASLQAGYAAQLRALAQAAQASLPIVLNGESGTGKEILAHAVHQLSGRPGAFQAINCAALPQSLVESELFGYRKGAFSGATEDRRGLLRSADHGTLFLDEVGDLSLPAQGALLRVLQESEVLPVGATQPVPVDFRLVVATHRNLEQMAAEGRFRHDLLARMSGFALTLPPLRERKEDLGALIAALLQRHAPARAAQLRFTAAAARALFLYRWPLNVRELEKALLLALAVAPEDEIDLAHIPPALRLAAPAPADKEPELPLEEAKRREELLALLREHRGNVTAVARALGKARVQVQRWMRRYGLRSAVFR
jgi:transcriptional regulator of acetoin/glycerol metabolism